MPFTPSHIAAVLPLVSSPRVRKVLDPWALAMGAMVPDLPIFLPFLPDYTDWHSLRGVLTIDIAAVLALLALFHLVVRDPLITLLPPGLAGRAATLLPSWRSFRVLPIVMGALVGAGTHVLWDSFTHSTAPPRWGDWLAVSVFGVIRLFRLLQYVSSVVGLAVVVWWVWRGLSRIPAVVPPARLRVRPAVRFYVLGAASAGTIAGALLWPVVDPPSPELGVPSVITKVGAGTIVGLGVVLLGYALVWQVTRLMAVSERA
ncbi:DUF4184 family protein [Nonomuraea sp. 3-1Str]|uniref:DUF4184 family protein n=1 Tax=Nonomuraea sp. 3-1Str TaxID=2929801 RepID=UPI0028564CFE|nr:DUF4184 family protein [Nonomuraea sp. 3-1Str]MDR8414626.1 DUF4184 family protein [Nonomuraea sp. 3-1Str]